ncbi:LEUCINE-RICH REPEAT-CONTAINING [Salix koriyanagi]|uniref:LEUCINE-RICH REPEAT-CONTAINING n=1 Tax=Salix koriyanagi TaxID=2511006 RepID=A0A9Q1ABI3_9ROSI|nr:LEUCINE-RICH REPEAT-CONTAINING [Salix koriyanagi]
MDSLKELVIDKTAIYMLPQSLYRLTKLEKLSLNGCKFIKRLPERLGNLISLKVLSLNHSAVEELPGSVGSLSNLEELSLMGCRSVTTIPESIRNLQSLMKFSINGSPIKELPTAIGSLPYLKTLFAGGCHVLSKLPDSIGGLASISELQLDGTSISDLPEQIGGLKMIQKLLLRNCTSLRALPEAIGMILNLTTIDLFGCNITELPESFGKLENLEMLILNECKKLHKLPDSTGELKSLCHLLMKKTAVTVLPGNFGNLSRLMILEMQKDPLESPRTQDQSAVLPNFFTKLSLLEELNARAWRISGKIPDDFEKLSSLKVLDLGNNNFSSLPSSLCGLSLLQKLHLPHCEELVSLPPLPPSLEELDASNCFGLETIADVSGLERLTLLDITNCEKVVDIPGIECLKFLKRLYMSCCKACSLKVKRRLSKVCLRNIRNLSMPGSKLPDWFSQESVVHFSERKNRTIKAVIVCVVVSLDHEIPEDLRYSPICTRH